MRRAKETKTEKEKKKQKNMEKKKKMKHESENDNFKMGVHKSNIMHFKGIYASAAHLNVVLIENELAKRLLISSSPLSYFMNRFIRKRNGKRNEKKRKQKVLGFPFVFAALLVEKAVVVNNMCKCKCNIVS